MLCPFLDILRVSTILEQYILLAEYYKCQKTGCQTFSLICLVVCYGHRLGRGSGVKPLLWGDYPTFYQHQ